MTACAAGRYAGDDAAADLVRRRIEAALRVAGLDGVLPTPLDEIARYAGINEILDIGEFNSIQRDAHRRRRTTGVVKRFAGAVFFRERVVLVDTSKPEPMRRWTEAHEVAHKLLPWHEEVTYLDDDHTLSRNALEQHEFEANVGGAHLLFQGDRFWERGLSYRQGLAVPVTLAPDFGASLTATIRYYVETNPDPVALVCASGYVQQRSRAVAYCEQSPGFTTRFGSVDQLFPSRIPVHADGNLRSTSDAIRFARSEGTIGFGEMLVRDLSGDTVQLDIETFFNGFNVFVLARLHRRVALGKRIRVQRA